MAFGVIYLITNLFNGMKYVGQTTRSVEQRFKEHFHEKTYIGNAMRKHSMKNFTIEVIETCETREQLNEREKFWIAELKCMSPSGYNLTEGGEGIIGWERTPEYYAKLSVANKGKNKGRHLSAEHRAKLSEMERGEKNPFFGKRHTKKSLIRMSVAKIGNKYWLGRRHKSESIVKISKLKRHKTPYKNLLNEIDKQQLSYHALAKLMEIAQASISRKMSGKRKFNENEIAKLVEIFGKPAEYLMARDDE